MLGLDTSHGVRDLEDDEKDLHIMQTLGGKQEMTIVSEAGLQIPKSVPLALLEKHPAYSSQNTPNLCLVITSTSKQE